MSHFNPITLDHLPSLTWPRTRSHADRVARLNARRAAALQRAHELTEMAGFIAAGSREAGSREADDAEFIDELLADAHRYLAEVASIDSLRAA